MKDKSEKATRINDYFWECLLGLKEKLARCKMVPEGYVEYKRREFCKDVKCPFQVELNKQNEGSPIYEQTRQKCGTACLYTTWQFHHWLIKKGYLIVRPSKEKV